MGLLPPLWLKSRMKPSYLLSPPVPSTVPVNAIHKNGYLVSMMPVPGIHTFSRHIHSSIRLGMRMYRDHLRYSQPGQKCKHCCQCNFTLSESHMGTRPPPALEPSRHSSVRGGLPSIRFGADAQGPACMPLCKACSEYDPHGRPLGCWTMAPPGSQEGGLRSGGPPGCCNS